MAPSASREFSRAERLIIRVQAYSPGDAPPTVSAPFSASFMLPVPEASSPAVEICSDRSAAGMIRCASETS